jgi:hypothetical protein
MNNEWMVIDENYYEGYLAAVSLSKEFNMCSTESELVTKISEAIGGLIDVPLNLNNIGLTQVRLFGFSFGMLKKVRFEDQSNV